jgi:hypothetical protein
MPSRYKKRKQIDQTIIELHEKGIHIDRSQDN